VNDQQRNANLEGVGFIDENTGWVGGWGDREFERRGSSTTSDGGRTWRDANEIGRAINRFRFFGRPVTVGYASGETVYKYAPGPVRRAMRAVTLAAAERRHTPVISQRTMREQGACISFVAAPADRQVHVRIWDRFGEEVTEFNVAVTDYEGSPAIQWNLKDKSGRMVPPGHYIVRLQMGDEVESCLLRLIE